MKQLRLASYKCLYFNLIGDISLQRVSTQEVRHREPWRPLHAPIDTQPATFIHAT
jgi:hypothetical protein